MRTASKKAQFILNDVVNSVKSEQKDHIESEFVSRLVSEIATKSVRSSFH